MAQPNVFHLVIDEATLTEVRQAIGVLRTKLVPHLKKLSAAERKELPRLGERTTSFVQKAFDYTAVHPDLVPPFLDCNAFRVDLEALDILNALDRELEPVNTALADSITLAGSEAYQAALLYYNNVKTAKKIDLGSSAVVYEELSSRFPGASARKS